MKLLLFATLVSGCAHPVQPNLRTYGIMQPACVIGCRGVIETVDGPHSVGGALTGTSNVTATPAASAP